MFSSFKIINDDLSNYYFIIIINGTKYYLKINNIDDNFIYIINYNNLPNSESEK